MASIAPVCSCEKSKEIDEVRGEPEREKRGCRERENQAVRLICWWCSSAEGAPVVGRCEGDEVRRRRSGQECCGRHRLGAPWGTPWRRARHSRGSNMAVAAVGKELGRSLRRRGHLDREPEDGAGGFSVGNRGGKGSREIWRCGAAGWLGAENEGRSSGTEMEAVGGCGWWIGLG